MKPLRLLDCRSLAWSRMGSNLRETSWGEFFCFPWESEYPVCVWGVSGSLKKHWRMARFIRRDFFFARWNWSTVSQSTCTLVGLSFNPIFSLPQAAHNWRANEKSAGAACGRFKVWSLKALKFLGLQANHKSYLGGQRSQNNPSKMSFPNGSVRLMYMTHLGGHPFGWGD